MPARRLTLWALSILLHGQLCAQSSAKVEAGFSCGAARQEFRWSIAGNLDGRNPNIYSEIVWKELKGLSTGLKISVKIAKRFSFDTSLARMFILSGQGTDTDYLTDNRQDVAFTGKFESNSGSTQRVHAMVHYQFIDRKNLSVSAGPGYSWLYQSLRLQDDGSLNSSYETRWHGPLIHLRTRVAAGRHFNVAGEVTYHQLGYTAVANWNLIDTFQHPVSFKHRAKGYGITLAIGGAVLLNQNTDFGLTVTTTRCSTGAGVDELYLASGNVARTKLNDATWCGLGLELALRHRLRDHRKK